MLAACITTMSGWQRNRSAPGFVQSHAMVFREGHSTWRDTAATESDENEFAEECLGRTSPPDAPVRGFVEGVAENYAML